MKIKNQKIWLSAMLALCVIAVLAITACQKDNEQITTKSSIPTTQVKT